MTLNIFEATTLDDLAAQCDARTTGHLARLMLRTFAELGAAEAWDDLGSLAEDLARSAERLGIPVDTTSALDLTRWQCIADTEATPPAPQTGADALTLSASALTLSAVWGDNLAPDLAGSLTCREADALVAVFDAVGAYAVAQDWRTFHAERDAEGDAHYLPTA